MEIKIIPLGCEDRPLDSYGRDGQSFAEAYAPVIAFLLRESRLHAVVHTVPGGPAMARAVCQLLEEARRREGDEAMPFDVTPIVDVTARLRREDGCPWDRSQTHRTLRRYLIEEVYEMLDAIDSHDIDGIREELGDILYQVAIHARIAQEKGLFSAQDVVKDVTDKMIRRHPHVFSQKSLENIGTSMLNWDRLKQGEQRQQHAHLLDGVVPGLPTSFRKKRPRPVSTGPMSRASGISSTKNGKSSARPLAKGIPSMPKKKLGMCCSSLQIYADTII